MENDADALALWAKCAPGGSEESVDFDRFCAEFERCHTVELKQTLPADFALALRFVMFPESSTFTSGQLKVSRGDFDLFLKRLGPMSMAFRKMTQCFFYRGLSFLLWLE